MSYGMDKSYLSFTVKCSRFAPSQWETALRCNDVSHWPGGSLESALCQDTCIRRTLNSQRHPMSQPNRRAMEHLLREFWGKIYGIIMALHCIIIAVITYPRPKLFVGWAKSYHQDRVTWPVIILWVGTKGGYGHSWVNSLWPGRF